MHKTKIKNVKGCCLEGENALNENVDSGRWFRN